MRVPRLRFTVRRMMVVVAIVALCTRCACVIERRFRFRRLAEYHLARTTPDIGYGVRVSDDPEDVHNLFDGWTGRPVSRAWVRWHKRLHGEYERAARCPWLPVAPDPPGPE